MTRRLDPELMSPEERLAELGTLLALAYRRLRLSPEKPLAEMGRVERAFDRTVDAPESPEEVA